MRNRRKPRVVWLPQTNANSLGAAGTAGYQVISIDAAGLGGDFAVGEIPLVIDGEQDPLGTTTLSDIENSGYRLRRIVGKIWLRVLQLQEDTPLSCIVTAGIIVRRSNDETGQSLVAMTADGELMSPGQIRNWADPWIWRRSWILGNNSANGGASQTPARAETNEFFSAVDGPHIDVKTARIIGPEERLFLNVSSTVLDQGGDPQITMQCKVITDIRCLASMRTTSGNRRNASR